MSKNKKAVVSQEDFEAALKGEVQVFDALTMGIAPRVEGGYNIVKIALDSKGLEAGEVTVVDTAESKAEAIEKFKINAIRSKVL